ncbi:sugar transferase [Sphingomicrobium sp. XHP0235]|uniref:sugar transferase n=1 Tax=Sphingomicrobium aquimarinum TaxID=3133971 RepID=UPI0031FF10F2
MSPDIERRVIVAGASGRLGRALVPALRNRGYEVVVLGRDVERLARLFPGHEAVTYDALDGLGPARALVNLAVVNTDVEAHAEAFDAVNHRLAVRLADAAAASGMISVQLSSTHALDLTDHSAYAETKRRAVDALSRHPSSALRVITLPKIVFESPSSLAGRAWTLAASLKPVVFVDDVVDLVHDAIDSDSTASDAVMPVCARTAPLAYRTLSAVADRAAGAAILLLLGWVILLLALAVRFDSRGNPFFLQKRVGQHERPFTLLKLRTMRTAVGDLPSHEVGRSAVTRLGHFLRRTKLDELPQAWNLLLGQIALVGPRPCLPTQDELVSRRRAAGVFAIKPGITGYAQVHHIDMSDPERLVDWERRYLALRGLALDVKLLLATVRGSGAGDRTRAETEVSDVNRQA